MRNHRSSAAAGFTLIEMMAVVIIIGLLATIVTVSVFGRVSAAKQTVAKTQITKFREALEFFRLDNGFFPSTEQGLQALVRKPTTGRVPTHWREPHYMERIPEDPWGDPYVYICPGTEGREYDLICYGADGQPGGAGDDEDIVSWKFQE